MPFQTELTVMTNNAFRTPDAAFDALPDFPWAPKYIDDLRGAEGLRMAYLDEGPRDAKHTFLLLHGEPTWSFLYRKMIPVFLQSGARIVAPDFFGFGRSDKPADEATYTFHFHRDSVLRLIERLELQNVTLVVQDWGGLLGLTLPVDAGARARITRLLVMNTGLIAGENPGKSFLEWQGYVATHPDFEVGKLLSRSVKGLTPAEVAAYDAPFPDARFKMGVRRFPALVMTRLEMEGVTEARAARAFWKNEWAGKSFMAIGAQDPIFSVAAMESLRSHIRDCPPALVLAEAGHFVQESGELVARAALTSFGD